MASLEHRTEDGRDSWVVRARIDGRAAKFYCGSSKRKAEKAKGRIEDLIDSRKLGDQPCAESKKWVRSLDP